MSDARVLVNKSISSLDEEIIIKINDYSLLRTSAGEVLRLLWKKESIKAIPGENYLAEKLFIDDGNRIYIV